MQTARIVFKKMHENAKIPKASRDGDIGLDICSLEDVVLQSHTVVPVKTGIQLANVVFESPVFLKVEGRSGMAKKGIIPVGGIVDATYRGEIIVMLASLGSHGTPYEEYHIKAGDKIAQLIVYPACTQGINLEISEGIDVTDTVRGDQGFGSSGR